MMSHSGLMSSWRSIRPPLQDRRSIACEGRVGDAGSGLHPARVGRVRTMVRPSLRASRLWFAGLFMMLMLLVVERPPHGDLPRTCSGRGSHRRIGGVRTDDPA